MKIIKPRKNANPNRRLLRAVPKLCKAVNEANAAMVVWLAAHGVKKPTAKYFTLVEDRRQLSRVRRAA